MDAEKDDVLVEVKNGTVIIPISEADSEGIYQQKEFRLNETFYLLLMKH